MQYSRRCSRDTMRSMQSPLRVRHLVIAVIFELLILAAVLGLLVSMQKNQQALRRDNEIVVNRITTVEQSQRSQAEYLALLADADNLSSQELADLRAETLAEFESQQTATSQAVETVRTELETEVDNQTNRITSVVDAWKRHVALVECGDNGEDVGRGSGTLFSMNGELFILTNRHVVVGDENTIENECTVTFPDDTEHPIRVERSTIVDGDTDEDWAKIYITKPTPHIVGLLAQSTPWCDASPRIGEDIIIAGFPAIGAEDDVTITTGIVSAYDDSYIISTAKIDRGNSGGAAIWVDENCYLGIPTKVYKGVAESLARILEISAVPR